jgi:hypothetical protein
MIAVPLIAGERTIIGHVLIWLDDERLHGRFVTTGDWRIERSYLALGERLGCFDITTLAGASQDPDHHDVVIDLAAAGLAEAERIMIAAHAEVDSWTEATKTAWADGLDASGCPSLTTHFSLNLAELRGLVLWNKLGSIHEITHSEVGPNGVVVGDISLYPAQHGDGFCPNPRDGNHNIPTNYVTFPGLQLGRQGSIEFWYQPEWEDGTIGHIVDILYYGVPDDAYDTHLTMTFNDWQNRLSGGALEPRGTASIFVRAAAPLPGWSMTAPIHLALTWSGDTPKPADRLQMFVNGVALPDKFYFGDPRLGDWRPEAALRLGSRLVSGDWRRHNWEGLDGVIDNIKIWNYPKLDFSDRFTEGQIKSPTAPLRGAAKLRDHSP